MIADRQHVADQLAELAERLRVLSTWIEAPTEPFPADETELGEFMGRAAVLLLAGGSASEDGR